VRIVAQRVSRAEVRVEGTSVGELGPGLLVLLGVGVNDDEGDAEWLARKCASLRIFDDEDGQLNRSLRDVGGGALVVSQFTLYGDARKGRRPSWAGAAPPDRAVPLLERFCEVLEEEGVPVTEGRFGAHMEVELVNDGPVTLMVSSPRG